MSNGSLDLIAGARVSHGEYGSGVFITSEPGGFARVFFQEHGERQVPATALEQSLTWEQKVLANVQPATPEAVEAIWLALEAEQLPLMESSPTLTAAKVDLLPHQIVLTYRIANASPRRFLIADSVGLGKTIETALILRELASRGELKRALMVVPAGLVDNWRRELNETFHLDFEVFGSQGDVTDRKSNAFAKHNRMIASIDTLKRPKRVKNLMNAPAWDLIVFDEAHHLTATRSGNRVTKTQNFKLAESLREQCRDLLLLSATPHQGDHFRFWMLIRLLSPTLFLSTDDMIDNRYRLNSVVFRRTQADACDADGEPLFARRQVHTNAFKLTDLESRFYNALNDYLRDGYDLAAKEGNKGRGLGFVMTIFQKIAASSFAAVSLTLRRRLLALTIHEAVVCDENLDVDGREAALNEARRQLREMHQLSDDPIGRAEVDRLLADARVKLLRKLGDKVAAEVDSEAEAALGEDAAAMLVSVALPAERQRIAELLDLIPLGDENKALELLRALGDLWSVHPKEKIVVFTTYLGSVDSLKEAIDRKFPDAGVDVLKGGDHGAKLAAERRFRKPNGPCVLICTAAGREGINLQFARVLFNHDLPWNPMDVEQRIGRIHRYGQQYTAQVYNLVSAETIEGQIYLLLEEKLLEIGRALGKVDEFGQVAEDLREQILGQLSEKLSYERLYQEAIQDPTLIRTKEELQVAIDNARTTRTAVFELFQDMDDFRLDDYHKFEDGGAGLNRLVEYVRAGVRHQSGQFETIGTNRIRVSLGDVGHFEMTTDRDEAVRNEELSLLGLEHPIVDHLMRLNRELDPSRRGVTGTLPQGDGEVKASGVLTFWHVHIHGPGGQYQQRVVPIGIDEAHERSRIIERMAPRLREMQPTQQLLTSDSQPRKAIADRIPEMLQRELSHKGWLPENASFSSKLLAWVEIS
jgi:ERCC4-related helicase